MLNNPYYDPLRGFSLDGTAAHVSLGWLQTPHEFARDCLSMVQRPQFDAWAVATQLPDEKIRILESPLVPNASSVDVMASEQGILYAVVTLQSAALQVRLLLSLATRNTQDWFRAVTSDGIIHISLEVPEKSQSVVVSLPCDLQASPEVEIAVRRCAVVDREAFLRDAAKAARHLADLGAMPSLIPGFETQELRLVLVLDAEPGYASSMPGATARVLN